MQQWIRKQAKRLKQQENGSVTVILILLLPALFVGSMVAIDLGRMSNTKQQLQNIIDQAGVGAIGLYNSIDENPASRGAYLGTYYTHDSQLRTKVERAAQSIFATSMNQQKTKIQFSSNGIPKLTFEHLCVPIPDSPTDRYDLNAKFSAHSRVGCLQGNDGKNARLLKISVSFKPQFTINNIFDDPNKLSVVTTYVVLEIPPIEINVLIDNTLSMGLTPVDKRIQRLGVTNANNHLCFYACHQNVGIPIARSTDRLREWKVEKADGSIITGPSLPYPQLYGHNSNDDDRMFKPETGNPYFRIKYDKARHPDDQTTFKDDADRLIKCSTDFYYDYSMSYTMPDGSVAPFYGCPAKSTVNGKFLYTVRSHADVLAKRNLNGTILPKSPVKNFADFNKPENNVMGIQYFERAGDLARAMTTTDPANDSGRIIVDDLVTFFKQGIIDDFLKIYAPNYNIRLYKFDGTVNVKLKNDVQTPLNEVKVWDFGNSDGLFISTVAEYSAAERDAIFAGRETVDLIESGTNLNTVFQSFYDAINAKPPKYPRTKRVALFMSDGVHDRAKPASTKNPFVINSKTGNILAPLNVNPNRTSEGCAVFQQSKDGKIPLSTLRVDNNAWYLYARLQYRATSDKPEQINYFECHKSNGAVDDLSGVATTYQYAAGCYKEFSWTGHKTENVNYHSGNAQENSRAFMRECAKAGGGQYFDTNFDGDSTLEKTMRDFKSQLRTVVAPVIVR